MIRAGFAPSAPARTKFAFRKTPPKAGSGQQSDKQPEADGKLAESDEGGKQPGIGLHDVLEEPAQPGVSLLASAPVRALDGRSVSEQPFAARDLAPPGREEDRGLIQPDDEPEPCGRRAREQEASPPRLLQLVRPDRRPEEPFEHGTTPFDRDDSQRASSLIRSARASRRRIPDMKRLIAGIAIALMLAACTSPSTGATPVADGRCGARLSGASLGGSGLLADRSVEPRRRERGRDRQVERDGRVEQPLVFVAQVA